MGNWTPARGQGSVLGLIITVFINLTLYFARGNGKNTLIAFLKA